MEISIQYHMIKINPIECPEVSDEVLYNII